MMGRQFEGEAFKPTPAVVLFKDFEVGQTYRQLITLTNTSLARNAFKVSTSSHHPSHDVLHNTGCSSLQASCVKNSLLRQWKNLIIIKKA